MILAVHWALYHSKSTGLDRLILLFIADHYNQDEMCAWPSIKRLAREASVSESTVKRALATLEELGELKIEERKQSESAQLSNLYSLPLFEQFWENRIQLEDQGRGSNRTPGGQAEPQGGSNRTQGRGSNRPTNLLEEEPVSEPEEVPPASASGLKFPKPEKKQKSRKQWPSRDRARVQVQDRTQVDYGTRQSAPSRTEQRRARNKQAIEEFLNSPDEGAGKIQ